MDKIKEIYQHDGTDWNDLIHIGADAEYVDVKIDNNEQNLLQIINDLIEKAKPLNHYPVGSYYETSDESFNPNIEWGGEWDLETEGKVHISGSTDGSYIAGSSYGSNTKSYTPSGTVGTTKLSDANIAHGHTVTQPAFTGPSHYHSGPAHTHNTAYKEANRTGGGSAGTRMGPYGVSASGTSAIATSSAGTGNTGNAGTGACTRTTNVGVADLSGASSTRTAHGHGFTGTASNLDMMQDSIAVYRWHRTA